MSRLTHVERAKSVVRREVRTLRGAALVVMLAPEGLYVREKRRRRAYLLPWGVAHQVAVRAAVDADRAERKPRKRRRRRLRS